MATTVSVTIVGGDRTVNVNEMVTYDMNVLVTEGSGAVTYRWRWRRGTRASWSRFSRAKMAPLAIPRSGTYQIEARATNNGVSDTDVATITVVVPPTRVAVPTITPSSQTVARGQTFTFTANAQVTNPVGETTYRWVIGNSNVLWRNSATAVSITTASFPATRVSTYRVQATNNGVTSGWATATLTMQTKVEVSISGDSTAQINNPITLTAVPSVIDGDGATTYQWQQEAIAGIWADIVGATGSTYVARGRTAPGSRQYRVRATNNGVSATSGPVTATWTAPPPDTVVTVDLGPDVTLELGAPPYPIRPTVTVTDPVGETTYKWKRQSRDISGDTGVDEATTQIATFRDASIGTEFDRLGRTTPANFVYQLTVTNNGVSASDTITITVNPPATVVVAMAGPDFQMGSGETREIRGGARITRAVGVTSYTWELLRGNGVLTYSGSVATYQAEQVGVGETETATLQLSVINNTVTDTDEVTITIVGPVAASEPVQLRYGFRVFPEGERRGFAYWNGSQPLVHNGVTYQPGEVRGISQLDISFTDTNSPAGVLLDGKDPVFRAWLQQGPGIRRCALILFIKGTDWEIGSQYIGIASEVTPDQQGGFVFNIDPETYTPTPLVRLQWSDETQQELFPGDRAFENMKRLAEGVTVIWPR